MPEKEAPKPIEDAANRTLQEAYFITDLVARKSRERHSNSDSDGPWVLVESIFYYSALYDTVFIVPSGFTTDFASVPRLPLAYLLTGDTVHAPAVVHDWLIRFKKVPRVDADRIFLEAMKADGVPWWRRTLMYIAVSAYSRTAARLRRT